MEQQQARKTIIIISENGCLDSTNSARLSCDKVQEYQERLLIRLKVGYWIGGVERRGGDSEKWMAGGQGTKCFFYAQFPLCSTVPPSTTISFPAPSTVATVARCSR
ncbi:hypothetical protein E2C01_023251 [Portunus trituberculatus]|uniref:Uncharacterized protein n=1 Tax=Portunus trituberculatus TaxID=210409 RepID=A0A5B7E9H3_PORTR|nr:hypothetical protein [Portunus trituberculatus]